MGAVWPGTGIWGKAAEDGGGGRMAGAAAAPWGKGRAAAALCHQRWGIQMWGARRGTERWRRGTRGGNGGNAAGRPRGFVCFGRDGGAGRGGTNLPSNRGPWAEPGPFPSKIQREGPRWGCTSSFQSGLAAEAVSTRFIRPDGSERLGAAAFWGSPSSHCVPKVAEEAAETAVGGSPFQTAFPPPG